MSFTAGVWWEQRLIMNNYMVRVYMLTNCAESASQNTAFERLKYFVYNELSSTIFVNRDCELLCKHLASAGIKMTTMLYSKLNAIMEDRIVINEVAISSELGDNMIYLQTADETLGPFEPPGWWHDSNLIHYDLTLIDSDKVVAMHRAGAWRELGLAWAEQEPTPDSDNRVVFADFNPDNEAK